jgi:hypothetical protein
MNLPQEPSKIPPVRRYQRSFYADRTKTFRGEEVVKIQIPPISKTYFTKDVKLHFDLDISYYENTTDNMQVIADTLTGTGTGELNLRKSITYGFFGRAVDNTPNPNTVYFQTMSKPFPTLDINGPYGLINRIQVHDYLGTTLIEDIQSHDVLTAVMSDFMFTNDNVEIFRPEMSSEEPTFGGAVFKPPASLPFNSVHEFEDFMMKPYNTTITWTTAPIVEPMKPVSIPRYHATLDLFSFLGKLSQKFVPLHNGFTISFTLNRFDVPIGFSNGGNPAGVSPPNNELVGFVRGYTGVNGQGVPNTSESLPVYFKPTLNEASIKNMYIKSTLIEVDQQLDDQIEKVVQCVGYKYQLDYFPNADTNEKQVELTRRLLPQLKSLRRVLVGQRPRFNPSDVRKQRLGFRVKNFIDKSALLFNKSIISSIESNLEAYNALRSCYGPIDKYLTMSDFGVEYESNSQFGDQSWLMNTMKLREFLNAIQIKLNSQADYSAFWFDASFYDREVSELYGNQGKHLLCFDCVVPGSTANTVAGIDTSSNVVEYQLKSTKGVESVNIDVFLEHDAFVHVDPGKATAVSF